MKITNEELNILQQLKNNHERLALQLESSELHYRNAMLMLFLKYKLEPETDNINLTNGEINQPNKPKNESELDKESQEPKVA